ncbi:glycosyltransferase [Nocardioides sp. SLBN-35]|uniref:glycosyltransferase n=1 Tax=Nocardioides sp. SLBN-35 TaxID=2768445 RepID=UPI0011536199|nr:glycosyltransferase [Nocardioides sp. SLBN-35]TQK71247.1 glycosyltransferase involved in cell wall biosynthesis [Nocardioides sp. SLBN-35]
MTQVLDPAAVSRTGQQDRLRITVVQQGGVLGGAERWQLQLAEATDRADLDVVALGGGPTAATWSRRGVPVATVRSERRASRIPLLAARVGAALRSSRPDVVVAHGVKAALAAAPTARALGIPFVWVRHDGSFEGWPTALLDRVSDGQVATGAWLLEGRRLRSSLLLNPPRTTDHLTRVEARGALGLEVPSGRLVAGMGTRIVHGKGIDDAIRALADPAAAAWDLVVAGIHDPDDPGEQLRLVALATELGVAHRVRFLGEVPGFARLAGAFDAVLVLTKPTESMPWHREAFGMTAFEALTAGVPVVVTPPLGAMAREGGVEVRAGAPGDVAAALLALEDPDTRTRCGTAGARVAASYPDARAAADVLVDFLATLAHRPGVGLPPTGPAISVVTTVLDDEAAAKELLSALVPQLGPHDEVVVVDGGSSDDTAGVVRAFAAFDERVRLLVEPGAGISQGRNIGIRAASHDRIACTDAGCVPSPGWLAAFRRAFARHPEVDLWTGTYRVGAAQPWEHALAAVGYPSVEELARPTPLARAYGRLFGRAFDASMPTGRSVAFARVAWASVGGFPENLQTGEDVLFGRRIVAAGGTARMVRDAEVSWAQRPTFRANLTMYRRYGEGSGNSLDRRLLGRDLARVAAYTAAAGVALRGSTGARAAASAGLAAYLSLPVGRALQAPDPLRTVPLVAPVAAARDLVKAYGALSAAVRRRGRPR